MKQITGTFYHTICNKGPHSIIKSTFLRDLKHQVTDKNISNKDNIIPIIYNFRRFGTLYYNI